MNHTCTCRNKAGARKSDQSFLNSIWKTRHILWGRRYIRLCLYARVLYFHTLLRWTLPHKTRHKHVYLKVLNMWILIVMTCPKKWFVVVILAIEALIAEVPSRGTKPYKCTLISHILSEVRFGPLDLPVKDFCDVKQRQATWNSSFQHRRGNSVHCLVTVTSFI